MLSQPTICSSPPAVQTLSEVFPRSCGCVPWYQAFGTSCTSTYGTVGTVGSDSVLRCKLVGHSNIKRYKLKRKQAAVFAIIAEHRFLASIARATPARYATEAARVAKKHSSSVFSPLGELANANGDK